MNNSFVLKGNICHSKNPNTLEIIENGFLVCEDGFSKGIFFKLPEIYSNLRLIDHKQNLILPGLTDLHIHAPQYSFRALSMDLELLDWLETNTFPEEAKYQNIDYAEKAYSIFTDDLKKSPNTRACIFATIHNEATKYLMKLLEDSGLVTMVGKVNMDRNSPEYLCEKNPETSINHTEKWLSETIGKFKNTYPILTPRFIPTCSDELMKNLKDLQIKFDLPMQSHLSENPSEIKWVSELCPKSAFYGDAYNQAGLFGGDCKTIMAHCVWSPEEEIDLMRKNGVFIAHCPQSNTNLSSGIAPVSKSLDKGLKIGLGSDVAGGSQLSVFRAMSDAIQASKLYWRLIDESAKPLTIENAFYMGTAGGGEFFGKVGKFDEGYEFDAVVIDDSLENMRTTLDLNIKQRLERIIYLSDDRNINAKYVRGARIL